MKVFDWLEATNPNRKGNNQKERMRLGALRNRVFKAAKTNSAVLAGAKTRGAIGRDLTMRMSLATQGDDECQKNDTIIRWEDEVTESEAE